MSFMESMMQARAGLNSARAALAELTGETSGEVRTRLLAEHINRYGLLRPIDVLLIGATGVGKSSTLNALFGDEVARVGMGVEPETQQISAYELNDYIRFHDSAGLGDSPEADARHARNITAELMRDCGRSDVYGQPYAFIDLVLVVLDGSSRDLGTTFQLLESVVLRAIEPERVVVAINQADMAMKGRHWQDGAPEPLLRAFLEEQALSVQARILQSTGLSIMRPVYYSAREGYKVDALFEHLLAHLPCQRRKVG